MYRFVGGWRHRMATRMIVISGLPYRYKSVLRLTMFAMLRLVLVYLIGWNKEVAVFNITRSAWVAAQRNRGTMEIARG